HRLDLPPFPTRRSSDLVSDRASSRARMTLLLPRIFERSMENTKRPTVPTHSNPGDPYAARSRSAVLQAGQGPPHAGDVPGHEQRSEEHTSELQSRSDLV